MKKLFLFCFLAFTTQINAASFSVTSTSDSGAGSLREAMLNANSAGGDDTITFSVTGTILLSTPLPDVTGSLSISGPGADSLTISGNNTNQIFSFAANTVNTLSGLKIADGYAANNLNGGAISNASDLTLTACVLANNQTAGGWGGAIFNSGNLNATGCRFENNRGTGSAGGPTGRHGDIWAGGGGGGAGFAGAIFTRGGVLNIADSKFVGNTVTGGAPSGSYTSGLRGGDGGGGLGGAGGESRTDGGNGGFGGGGGGGGNGIGASPGAGGAGGFGGGGGGAAAGGQSNDYELGGAGGYGGSPGGANDPYRSWSGGGGGGGAFGGAIFVESGTATFVVCIFSNNVVTGGFGGYGGAIFNLGGSLTGANCIISSNRVAGSTGGSANGGGISQHGGTTFLTNCNISANQIAGGDGGGYLYGTSGGGASGGGFYADGGNIVIASCAITSNSARAGSAGLGLRGPGGGGGANGGGIGISSNAFLFLTNCTVSGNQVKGGNGGTSHLTTSAGGDAAGGGLFIPSGTATVVNATIANNSAVGGEGGPGMVSFGIPAGANGVGFGGGIYSTNNISLLNTLISGNNSTNGPDGYGNFNSLGNNLVSNTNGITGLISSDLQNVNANLGPLADNGGPTFTHALLPGSPAINAANTSGAPDLDQKGVTRPQGSAADIGAYELEKLVILVDGRETMGGVVHAGGSATVWLATAYANGTIRYTLDGSQPTAESTLYSGPFVLTNSVTIRALAYNSSFSESVEAGPVQLEIFNIYSLIVTTSGGGTVSMNPPEGPYPSNTVVTLTALPATGKMFVNWSGDGTGTSTNLDVIMNQNKTIQANFTDIPQYSLNTSTTGNGTISLNPSSGTYLSNTVVTIVATPAAGWDFSNWSGDASGTNPTNSVTMNGNKNIRATFTRNDIPLYTLIWATTGAGDFSLNPPSSNSYLNNPYLSNTLVTIVATPTSGWRFSNWSGDASGTNPTNSVTMNGNKNIRATFTKIYSLTTTSLGEGDISVTPPPGDNGYDTGTVVTLTATASGTNKFYGWTGSANGTSNQLVLTMNWDKTVTAFFKDSSLVWQHSNGTLATWFTDRTNLLGSVYLNNGTPLPAGWKIVSAHDFDGGGSKDFLFQHTNGQLAVWFMEGNHLKNSLVIGTATDWRAFGVNDFSGDGKADILFQHVDGRLAVWLMDGTVYKSAAFLYGGKTAGVAWKAVGAKDFNADGKADVLFQNSNGTLAAWLMNNTNLTSSLVVQPNPGINWRLVGLGDLNNDNKTDFVFQNTAGIPAVWFMNGTNFVSSAYLNNGQPVTGWKIAVVK